MKIKLETNTDLYTYEERHYLTVNDKRISIGGSEPEDCIIGRDLIDGHDIISYIEMGYNAAKSGEELEIEYIEQAKEE